MCPIDDDAIFAVREDGIVCDNASVGFTDNNTVTPVIRNVVAYDIGLIGFNETDAIITIPMNMVVYDGVFERKSTKNDTIPKRPFDGVVFDSVVR